MSQSSSSVDGVLADEPFEALVERTHVGLRAYLAGLGARSADIDDLAQDAYICYLRSERPEGVPPFAWLRGIARNLCREHFRRLARRDRLRRRAISDLLAGAPMPVTPLAGDPRREALGECIAALAPAGQRLVELRYSAELQSDAIADRVGSTARAVRVALHRVRRRLAECIARRLAEEERA